jgi:acetylornithine deacetylase/succinyl-diaminopimelate desuccinylase-like protein
MPEAASPVTDRPADQTAAAIESQREVLLTRLLDYLAQPSVSATGEGFPGATQRAVDELRLAGLTPQVIDTPGRPAVVGHRAGPPGTPTVLIYGHYDVQPAGPRALWNSEPFEPVIRDGRIWGRGTGDNKGQHFAHLQALRMLLETEGGYPCGVTMILDGEEELGSPNLASLVAENRDLLAADVVVWSDGPVHESGRWCVLHGVRGILAVRLTCRGSTRPLHSGNFGNIVANPAWTLVSALASMRDADGHVVIDGFYDDVAPLPAAESAAFAALPLDLEHALAEAGASELDPSHGDLSYYERLGAIPTLTINGIETGDLKRTIIPNEATARLDVRLVGGQDGQRVFAAIQAHVAKVAPDVEVAFEVCVPASRTPLDNPYTPLLADAVASATGEAPLLIPAYGGTLPDYVWTDLLGTPSLGLPIANVDEANHAPNENLEVERYLTGIAISVAALRVLGARREVVA